MGKNEILITSDKNKPVKIVYENKIVDKHYYPIIFYVISHRDYEDNYNEILVSNNRLLKTMIEKYKKERKEKCMSIKVFEMDRGLIYSKGYDYDDETESIYEDCVNMKDPHWNC